MNKLLTKVPVNIRVGVCERLQHAARGHARIVSFISFNVAAAFALSILSEFPVSFYRPMTETKVLPDYGTGTYYTVHRVRDRYYSQV